MLRPTTSALYLLLLICCSRLVHAIVQQHRSLPEKILAGYSSRCGDGSVRRAVAQGTNVVIWAFAHFSNDEKESRVETKSRRQQRADFPAIHTNLDLECIKQDIQALDSDGFDDVVHLISFGGWNGPHLDARFSSQQLYKSWKLFAGDIFHGLDWDLEGNDDIHSPLNFFTIKCLERMGQISELAKKDGYIVSMAPAQSYLDFGTTRFSRYVNLTSFDRSWHPEFSYMGANVYAYILAKYGDAIDFVSIQFYESYSRAAYSILHLGLPASIYLTSYVSDFDMRGQVFWVNFGDDPLLHMPSQLVRLPLSKLVLGLANGWADSKKSLYIDPSDVQIAFTSLSNRGSVPRGFMFWTIDAEGQNGIEMADRLNQILHIR